VAIVGGGPGGLAAALEVRRAGCSCVVLERQHAPVDKACGEGLMPGGLAALKRWDVRIEDSSPFKSIRWVQEDGRHVEAELPAPGGMGIRRLVLHRGLLDAAKAAGADVREGVTVRSHRVGPHNIELEVSQAAPAVQGARGLALETPPARPSEADAATSPDAPSSVLVSARLLIAADGLHSPLRRAAGLELPASGPRRFGLRKHFAIAPWGSRVEVHFADGLEAYVTPAGEKRVGVAFLWEDGRVPDPINFDALLARFPALADTLAGAPDDSKPVGAGPLLQRVSSTVRDRLVLLGDAAGYVDAITGEGLSLAFEQARALGALLPAALDDPWKLSAYDDASRRAFRSYARLASWLVALARRPTLRRAALNRLIARPELFGFLLRRLTAPRA
jgi:flavin-dependent dehydrogenase